MGEEQETSAPAEPVASGMIADAQAAAERLEAANKRLEENLQRQEALAVERRLGGESSVDAAPKEESPEEYAKKGLRGELDYADN